MLQYLALNLPFSMIELFAQALSCLADRHVEDVNCIVSSIYRVCNGYLALKSTNQQHNDRNRHFLTIDVTFAMYTSCVARLW